MVKTQKVKTNINNLTFHTSVVNNLVFKLFSNNLTFVIHLTTTYLIIILGLIPAN